MGKGTKEKAKERFLHRPTKPIEVSERKISEITEAMRETGFQGRKLGESIAAWKAMLEEKETIIMMGLTGAMCPAGMRKIISFFIENRMIDCLVSTGANIFHDTHEALGGKHYVGTHCANDEELFKHGVDRIYDVFAVEDEFRKTDRKIAEFAKTLPKEGRYSSREFINMLGKWVVEQGGDKHSIIGSAYLHNVPIFIPALCDSSIGIGLMFARRKMGVNLIIDQMKDVDEITQMIENTKQTGVIYIGGGVPKNFIQQTEVIASILGLPVEGHSYAIQYTTDAPHWGGLSGCTFEEAVSWGKISPVAKKVQVFVDATIALPIVSHALLEKTKDTIKKRSKPIFDWSGDKLKIKFSSK